MANPTLTFGVAVPARQIWCQTLSTSAFPTTKTSMASSTATVAAARFQTPRISQSTTLPATKTTMTKTTIRAASSASPTTSSTAADLQASQQPLDWNTFFALRKKRRRYQVASSVVFAALGVTGGSIVLGSGAMDWLVGQFPLDPLIALGILTIAFGVLGWLAGPSVGSQLFYLRNSRWKAQMTQKEVEFFMRIRKNRVDPSNSSAGNPGMCSSRFIVAWRTTILTPRPCSIIVPDFYGEKIQSVSGYRQWLKDQRAFNKKRVTFV